MNSRGRRQRLDHIREIADSLRQSAGDQSAPDLTGSILDRVDAQRPFLSRGTRRWIILGRYGLGFTVAATVLGIALVNRWAPGAVELAARPAPLSTVVETVQTGATVTLADLRQTVETVANASSAREPGASGSASLFTLVASAPQPAGSQTFCCTMVGPAMPLADAVRHGCSSKCRTVCVDRPLADIGRLAGVPLPGQSQWRVAGGLPVVSTRIRSDRIDDLMPLLSDDDSGSAIIPR